MVTDGIRQDPTWKNGDHNTADFLIIAGSAPPQTRKSWPTRDDANKLLEQTVTRITSDLDAHDLLCAVNASRNYDPSPQLEKISAPVMLVMFVNSVDDFVNPPAGEREIKRVKKRQACVDTYNRIRRTAAARSRGRRCGSNI